MRAPRCRLRFANHPAQVARMWPSLPAEALRVLRLCDGTRSRAELISASGLAAGLLDRVLARLEQDGLVHRIEGRRSAMALPQSAIDWLTGRGPAPRSQLPRREEDKPTPLDASPSGEPDFSGDEELFFARSIEHLLEPEERPDDGAFFA